MLPSTFAALWRAGRGGNREAASFVSLFVCVNAVLLLVVGAFTSTEFGVGFLHDRYLFYVVPLWILATAVWAQRRVPLGHVGLGIGALLVLVPLATLPTYLLNADGGRRFDAIAAGLPSQVAVHAGRAEPARWWLVAAGLIAIGLVVGLTHTSLPRWLVLAPVAAVFALNARLRLGRADRGGPERHLLAAGRRRGRRGSTAPCRPEPRSRRSRAASRSKRATRSG